jgi:EmrB/QacA subfamily drug resistance transporter
LTERQQPSSDAPAPAVDDDGYKWRAFTAVAMSFVTMVMSTTMLFVALSSIADTFGVTLRQVSWVVIAQSLTISALMIPMGKLADLIGRRRVHLIGLAIFITGSLAAAAAPSLQLLVVAMVIIATGSSMGQSVGSAMIVSAFPEEERGRAIGSQGTAVALGAASGPILAGLVLSVASWRMMFLLVTVPMVVAFVVGWKLLDESRVSQNLGGPRQPFDWIGAALSATTVTVLVITMNNPFRWSWTSPAILAGALIGVSFLMSFLRWERRTPAPMLDLALFSNTTLRDAVTARLLGFAGAIGVRLLLPIFLISYSGYGEGTAGLVMFLGAVGLGLGSQASGRMGDAMGEARFVAAGFAIFISTAAAFRFVDQATSLWLVGVLVFFDGLAMGTWSVPNSSLIMGSVGAEQLGVTGALSNLTRNIGTVFGQAITSAIVAAVMVSHGFDVALSDIADTPGAGDAFLEGWRTVFLVLMAIGGLGLVLSLVPMMRSRRQPRPGRRVSGAA